MNKIILSLPKSVLKQYVINHFAELSVDDFFAVVDIIDIPINLISTNKVLCSNSNVLYRLLDINPYIFRDFNAVALNDICVNKLSFLNVSITLDDIIKYNLLVENKRICESFIKLNPFLIKDISVDDFNFVFVMLFENVNYEVDSDDIKRLPILLRSNKLMKIYIQNNPSFILNISNLSISLIECAISNGFVPKYEDFINNKNFKNSESLLKLGFLHDPRVIVFFTKDMLTDDVVKSAIDRGYVATESDLCTNKCLCDCDMIMEEAVIDNAELIKYIGKDCCINESVLIEVLWCYKITLDDIENNPNIVMNTLVAQYLDNFKNYTQLMDYDERALEIYNCLKSNGELDINSLPFLDFKYGSKVNIDRLSSIYNCLKFSIDEDNIDFQRNWLRSLDSIVDGIAEIRYIENKSTFMFSNVVSINKSLEDLFIEVSKSSECAITQYANTLSDFVGGLLSSEQIKNEVDKFYKLYRGGYVVDLAITSSFCNVILNQHRNYYISTMRDKIYSNIKSNSKLTKKKVSTIINGRKLDKVNRIITNSDFDLLGITIDDYRSEVLKVKDKLINNKKIKKDGILLDDSLLSKLCDIFMVSGTLNYDVVKDTLCINNDDIIKFIGKSFEKINFLYVDKIVLSDDESFISEDDKNKVIGFTQSNFIICDNDRYLENVSKVLAKLSNDNTFSILNNRELINKLLFLLPFVNLIDELNVDTFINALVFSNRIYDKMGNFNNIGDLINLANAYGAVDDINLLALGDSIVSVVGEVYSGNYLDFYKQMLFKLNSYIPPVKAFDDDLKMVSGFYSDPDRLLIGKKTINDSCIDLLNTAGSDTYGEVLLGEYGDVVLIRDLENNLYSRLLIFRRGNVIQIASKSGDTYPIGLYQEIAKQILDASLRSGDNIEYVFANDYSVFGKTGNCKRIDDSRFIRNFPHCDLCPSAYLVGSKNNDSDYISLATNIDFFAKPLASYVKLRRDICFDPLDGDITRLRALDVVLESDDDKKKIMLNGFEPFYSKDFVKVVSGEDWYLAIKEDGSFEEVVLPLNDSRAIDEIESVKIDLGLLKSGNKCLKLYR